jgi:predicted ATPase
MAMVEEIDGARALPEGLVAEIIQRTDGVPLFIEELTKAVLEAGASREGMAAVARRDERGLQMALTNLGDAGLARLV